MSCSLACTGESQEVNYTQCGGGWIKLYAPNPDPHTLNAHTHEGKSFI
jgi:hypothetical protein